MPETIPAHLEPVREKCRAALGKLRPTDQHSKAPKDFLFNAKWTDASKGLPKPYLIYFLMVDLLGFKDLGQFEKVAWSIPVDYEGDAYLLEHRKFGCGVFAADLPAQEPQAMEIVKLLKRAVKTAAPYFEWKAGRAADASHLNVVNHSIPLFQRYEYFLSAYQSKSAEAEARKDEICSSKGDNGNWERVWRPAAVLEREAKWMALATIEAFFSWTEHIFIHIAILHGRVTTGKDVAKLAESDWSEKFKSALSLEDPVAKRLFDLLLAVRRQLRNSVAHGSFGKNGEAFTFHSSAGAVPLLLPHQRAKQAFRFGDGVSVVDAEAIATLEDFVRHIWTDEREQAKMYVQDSGLPLILTLAADGTYAQAMRSVEEMDVFLNDLGRRFDDAANMDW